MKNAETLPVAEPLLFLAAGDPLPESGGFKPNGGKISAGQLSHLLRRASFSGSPSDYDQYLGGRVRSAVQDLVNAAVNEPLPPLPDWADIAEPPSSDPDARAAYLAENYPRYTEYRNATIDLMRGGGLREKMTFFWHHILTTSYSSYGRATYAVKYWEILRKHALGNFKDLIHEMGTTPAMLYYLNGVQNRVGSPNENYARELCELMTMGILDPSGQPNYDETDVQEIARALTGWQVNKATISGFFNEARHDGGEKTIFGQTGAWGYDELIDLIFDERGDSVAHYICRRIYKFFVYDEPNEDVVADMAAYFIKKKFELEPVVEKLLSSKHFFSDAAVGARIKSPIELLVGQDREAGFVPGSNQANQIRARIIELEMNLFQPPNVAGWPGHRNWISTTSLPKRWDITNRFLYGRYGGIDRQDLVEWLRAISGDSNDPDLIVGIVLERVMARPVPDATFIYLVEAFMGPIPPEERSYWTLNSGTAPEQGRLLMDAIYRLPEYQLA